MTTTVDLEIVDVSFLTGMYDNDYQQDEGKNNDLIQKWKGKTVTVDYDDDDEFILNESMNALEDTSGWLVGNVSFRYHRSEVNGSLKSIRESFLVPTASATQVDPEVFRNGPLTFARTGVCPEGWHVRDRNACFVN